jgi:hypothetical protein
MSLTCLREGKPLTSFLLSDGEWTEVKTNYRTLSLSMRCCSSAAIPKISTLGTRFFAHKSHVNCHTGPESPEHLQAKFIIATSARAAGWEAFAEASGTDSDGNPWVADVLCTRGEIKVAFEVQLAAQSIEDYQTRQTRYQRAGVRCLWLARLRRNVPESKELPLFLLDVKQPANMTVYVGEVPVPLGDFVEGALSSELFWAETRPGTRVVDLQIASITCYNCRKAIKAVRGYVVNNHFLPLAEASDTGAIAALVSALRQRVPEMTPVSQRFSKTLRSKYFAAACPFCLALLGNWPMTMDFFTEMSNCDYPSCSCPFAAFYGREIECRVFDYQTISLRLRPSELRGLPTGEWLWRPATRGANPPL